MTAEDIFKTCSLDILVPNSVIELPDVSRSQDGDTWLGRLSNAGERTGAFFGLCVHPIIALLFSSVIIYLPDETTGFLSAAPFLRERRRAIAHFPNPSEAAAFLPQPPPNFDRGPLHSARVRTFFQWPCFCAASSSWPSRRELEAKRP